MGEASIHYLASNMADSLSVSMAQSLVRIVLEGVPEANFKSHEHELVNIFIDLTSSAMRDLTTRFNKYAEQCVDFIKQGDFKKNAVTFQTSVQCVERFLMHHFRQRANYLTSGESDEMEKSKLSPNAHRFALKECRSQIVNELNIEGTTLMDDLVCASLMTEPERQSIVGKHTSKAKTEDFFRLIHGRVTLEQMKNILLPAIAIDHPWLSKHLRETMKLAGDAQNLMTCTCVCCRMRDHVEVKRIADYLLHQDIVSEAQHADLTNPAVPNSGKWKEVLASSKLNLYSVVVSSLEGTYPDLFNDFQFHNRDSLSCFCQELVTEVDDSSSDISVDTDVGRMSDIMSISTPNSIPNLKVYNMQPRNLCIILCNNNYSYLNRTTGISLTKMHDIDVANITQCFEKLNFETSVFKNFTGAKLVSICQELSSRVDLHHASCIAIFILCSTHSDCLIGTDGVNVPLENVLAFFKTKRCPQLAGKPKLFFIQTSRGKEEDTGMVVSHDRDDPLSPWSVLPDDADFFVGFPSASGKMSYGIPGKGSVYISSLVNVLDKYGTKNDLLSCMQMVNENMAQMNLEWTGSMTKQISFPMFSLRKQVIFKGDDSLSEGTSQSRY